MMVSILTNCTDLQQLDTRMDHFLDIWSYYSVSERIKLVDVYTKSYWQFTEREPQPARLKELADFILMDELADSHPDKVTRNEYPILTSKQVERRNRKTVLSGEETTTDYLNVKYNTWSISGSTNVHKKITTDKRA